MIRNLQLTLVLVLCTMIAFAQQQKDHKKTTFNKDGKFYINKDLPVYLHLSTSPDGNENKQKLESEKTAKYANPFYFDTEGLNTIRTPSAVDPETKKTIYPVQDVVFEVYADGLAPISSSTFSGAPKFLKSGVIYFGKGLSVNIKSTDGVSGVNKTFKSINGKDFSDYTTALNMNEEGEFTLKFYAVDNVGNAENTKQDKFTVDLSAPKTNHSTSQPKLNDILSPKAKISLSMSDNLAGVNATYYYFDSNTKQKYYNSLSLWSLSDGNHSLTYYTIDNVKNEEVKKTYDFYLDKIAPKTDYQINGDYHKGNYKYISVRTKIELSSSDNKAGVREISYAIDNTSYGDYNSEFKMPESNGLHYVNYFATDKVTNKESTNKLTVYVDSKNPRSSIRYGSPQFFHRDTLFVNKNTNIYLSSNDYESGVKKIEYKIDGGATNTYTSAFNIPNEGFHEISFFTTDNVNNLEVAKESSVFVDNTPPVIYHNFSINSLGTQNVDGKTLNVYPNYTRLYLGATDKHSGTNKIKFRINGGSWKDYSSPYTLDISEIDHFKKSQKYTVEVITEDKLGNESSKIIEFIVADE